MDVGAITLPPCFMNNIKPNSIYLIISEWIWEHFKKLRLKVKIETMVCLIGQATWSGREKPAPVQGY